MESHSDHVVLPKCFCGSGWESWSKQILWNIFSMTQSKWEGRGASLCFLLGLIVSTLDWARSQQEEEQSRCPWRTGQDQRPGRDHWPRPGWMEPCSYLGAPPSPPHPSEGWSLHSHSERASLAQSKIISALKGKRYGQYFNYNSPKSYFIHPSRQSRKRKIRYNCLTDRVDNIFAFFFSPPCVCLWNFSSPTRNWTWALKSKTAWVLTTGPIGNSPPGGKIYIYFFNEADNILRGRENEIWCRCGCLYN